MTGPVRRHRVAPLDPPPGQFAAVLREANRRRYHRAAAFCGVTGVFLAGIFGWDPRPSFEQVVVYLAYLIPSLVFFFSSDKPRKVPAGAAAEARTATDAGARPVAGAAPSGPSTASAH